MIFLCFGLLLTSYADTLAQSIKNMKPDLTNSINIKDWFLDGSGKWQISDGKLELIKAGVPEGPIRRPAAIAVYKSKPFTKLTLEAQIRCMAPVHTEESKYRDLILVFGYQSPSRFYYVHLSAITDEVHNGILVVNDADRRRLTPVEGKPLLVDQSWHRVRLTWDADSGEIAVYFDNSEKPVMRTTDKTIQKGQVGLGSFDDIGEFRDVIITGQ